MEKDLGSALQFADEAFDVLEDLIPLNVVFILPMGW
jgi:hypothetical protein